MAQGNPQMAELAKQFALFGARGFRVARPLEESIEAAFDTLAGMPPPQEGKPASGVDSPAALAVRKDETQQKAQEANLEFVAKMQQTNADQQIEREKLAQAEIHNQRQMGLDVAKAMDQAAFQREREVSIQTRGAAHLT